MFEITAGRTVSLIELVLPGFDFGRKDEKESNIQKRKKSYR